MKPSVLPRYADQTGRWAAIAAGFSIPISVALDNVLLLITLAGWIAGGMYSRKLRLVRANPVLIWALALFGILLTAAFWGNHPPSDAKTYLLKYLDLAFIPLFAYFFSDPETRKQGLRAFAGSLILVLMLSFLVKFGLLERGTVIEGTTLSPVVFKLRITHNFLMAFGAFLFLWLSISSGSVAAKSFWAMLALLAGVNVMLMVEGATGYLVFAALAALMAFSRFPRRFRVALALAAAVAGLLLVATPNPFSSRVATLAKELRSWQPGTAAHESSAGYRLEFYRNTLDIIAGHPLAGVGTGGFPTAYAERVRGTTMVATRNPHNEYLHIAAQTGLLGLTVLVALFIVQWRTAARLPTPMESGLARGLVLTMAIGCMFNSFLLDHAEGLFFAWMSGLLYAGLTAPATASSTA
ncbi:MAG: O-antigen ligase family protein [Burkholderiales bacterium]